MLAPRKRLVHVLSVIFLIVVLFLYHRDSDIIYFRWASALEALPDKPPANRTLGFGAVLVVSKEGSERRHSLLQAANVTDISLITPAQPKWTDNDVEQFRNGQEQGVQRGSILAWLGHYNVLQW
jgi:cytochrome c-type biogenesis protein CcmE